MAQHNLPILTQGDSGSTVALLQRLLILYGYPALVGTVDAHFGKENF